MAKLPLYEQQTSVGSVRASGQDFGTGVAQATGEMGGVVNDIGMQMKRRQDVIERVQLMTEFDKFAQDALTTLNDTEDISSPATVQKYSAGLREKAGEIVKRHGGTGSSRAELQAQIENQVGQYAKSATATQVKAQQQFIGTIVDQKANELAISGAFAPDKIGDLFTDLDKTIDTMADAMSPSLAAQYKEAGRSRIATSAIQNLLVQGQAGTAKKLMENPEVAKYLGADTARKFAIDIVVDERKNELETQRQNKNVASWSQRIGRDLTPQEVVKVRSMPEKKDMTVADQIVEYELITGKPAPQSVVDQFYKVDGPDGNKTMFGNSMEGRAMSFVTENAITYANGLLTPDQARQFEASVNVAYKPFDRFDPLSGKMERFTPTVPNFVKQAVDQGGRLYGGRSGTYPIGPQGESPQLRPGDTVTIDGRSATVGPNGTFNTDTNPQPSAPQPTRGGGASSGWGGEPQQQEKRSVDDMSLSELTPYLVGVSSGIGRTVADAPLGIGDSIGNSVYTRAASRAKNLVELATGASKPETKIADQYRQELKELVNIGPKAIGSELAYHSRIAEIDKELRRKLAESEKKIDGSSMSTLEERKAAVEIRNDILAVLPMIDHPQKKVKTREDFDKLMPGERFLYGDDPVPKTKGAR